ncbi:MAG: alpha/beta hydrolase [Thermomicrobiales bacterium]
MSERLQPGVFPIWPEGVPDADLWRDIGPELERPRWENSRLVRNVSAPTLTVYLPDRAIAVGTGIVICPGGAFHFLMVDKEGTEFARWFNARGVAVFVLKYRVFPSADDDAAFLRIAEDPLAYRANMDRVQPMAVADGLQAMRIVRQRASDWGIAPDRLGIMGFSAGGFVAAGVATEYDPESRPDFAAPIYAVWNERPVPADAPPLFVAAASDDALVDASHSLALYTAWHAAGRSAELHLYARGEHGFALIPQDLPADTWIDRFWEWLRSEGFVPVAGSA